MLHDFASDKQRMVYHVVMVSLRDEWPLTVRQVHYELVTQQACVNTKGAYNNLSKILTEWRIEGVVPWEAITDHGRPLYWFPFFGSTEYHKGWKESLLNYRRDLLQTQERSIELWVEKMALVTRFRRICDPLTVPVQVLSGFVSIDKIKDLSERVYKPTTILLFTDHDPSGLAMQQPLERRIAQITTAEIEVIRFGLTLEQVKRFGLVSNFDAIKPNDKRAPDYIEQYGRDAWELDALKPALLDDVLSPLLDSLIDHELLDEQRAIERVEIRTLREYKESLPDL